MYLFIADINCVFSKISVVGQPLIVTDVLVQRLRKLPWEPYREEGHKGRSLTSYNTPGCTDMHGIRVQR